jgi:hypothetical protein
MPEPFMHVTSDWGWIGNVHWTNSRREPYMDSYRLCLCRSWGGFEICPSPGLFLRGSKVKAEIASQRGGTDG